MYCSTYSTHRVIGLGRNICSHTDKYFCILVCVLQCSTVQSIVRTYCMYCTYISKSDVFVTQNDSNDEHSSSFVVSTAATITSHPIASASASKSNLLPTVRLDVNQFIGSA